MSAVNLSYMHYFRAITMIFIVAGHCVDVFRWGNSIDLERSLRIIVGNGSLLFVFIAGYLFQHLLPKYEYKRYLLKKFYNVIVPYLLCSIPAIIVFVFFMERPGVFAEFYQHSKFEQVILFLLTGAHLSPFWFIPMIGIFYICAPVFKYLDTSRYGYYLLPLLIVLSCMTDRGLPYESFVHFTSVYLLGMFFSHYKLLFNSVISSPHILILGVMLVLGLGLSEFYLMKGTMTWVNFLQKIMLSIVVLGFLIAIGNSLKSVLLGRIADYSFGIFFIHSYVISVGKILYEKFLGSLPDFNFLAYFYAVVLVMLTCMIVVFSVKFTFSRKSRLLIGS